MDRVPAAAHAMPGGFQAARLQRPGITFALAVLTQDNPKTATQRVVTQDEEAMQYGEQTIAGVTERLLGRAR